MARKIKVSASVLNVRLHPHSADIYRTWIEYIFSRKIIIQMHGDRHGMISTIDRSWLDRGAILGVITTFVKLEDGGTWFNAEQLTEATEDQVSRITIPPNLYPNAASFYFLFDLKSHRLYFQTYSIGKTLTPGSALKLFSGLAKNLDVLGEFREASISIVQDKASLKRMFSLKRIKEIQITILKPNADIFDDDFEENIERHLLETKSRQFSVTYKAEANTSIEPDDDMEKISNVALENGSVDVIGRDEKGAVRLNSQKFPREFHDRFDPEETDERNAFLRLIPHTPVTDE